MYFSMILNNQVDSLFFIFLGNQIDSYKYLPMNNLTFANKISRVALLNSPKDRKRVHSNWYFFKINWQIIKIIIKYYNVSYIKNKKIKTNQVHPFELNWVFL